MAVGCGRPRASVHTIHISRGLHVAAMSFTICAAARVVDQRVSKRSKSRRYMNAREGVGGPNLGAGRLCFRIGEEAEQAVKDVEEDTTQQRLGHDVRTC